MPQPSVYAYLDYRTFLQDWFDVRKRAEEGYSYAEFARAAGCSKAALANVISGSRTPRPSTLDAFARAMDLDPTERGYLGLLVELATAPDVRTRREIMEQILSRERYRQVRVAEHGPDQDIFRYLEHWYIQPIREMVGMPGFRDDPDWIAQQLLPPIRREQAVEALEMLLELGFIGRDEEGALIQREVRVRTEPEAMQAAATHFHGVVMPQILQAIDPKRAAEQHLLGATVTLHPDTVPEFKQRLNTLLEQLASHSDAAPVERGQRVYQIGMQLIPLTETVD